LESGLQTRIQNQGETRNENVVVLDETGRHTDTVPRSELESRDNVSGSTRRENAPERSDMSDIQARSIHEKVAAATLSNRNAETPESLEESIEGYNADVRKVRAETVDGKTVIREPGEEAATDNPQEYLVANVGGIEFIMPRTQGDGTVGDPQLLSQFGERSYNEPTDSPTASVPYEIYDTALDHSGQRVGRHYFESEKHTLDEEVQGGMDNTVDGLNLGDATIKDLSDKYEELAREQREAEQKKVEAEAEMGTGAALADATQEGSDVPSPAEQSPAYKQAQATIERVEEQKDQIIQEAKSRHEKYDQEYFEDRASTESSSDPSGISGQPPGGGAIDDNVIFRRMKEIIADLKSGTVETANLPAESVREAANKLAEAWPSGPAIRTVSSVTDLPAHIKQQARNTQNPEQGLSSVQGVYDAGSDTIHLVAQNIRTRKEVATTLLHEVAGHYGLRNIIEDGEFTSLMTEAFRALEGQRLTGDGRLERTTDRSETLLVQVSRQDGRIDMTTEQGKTLAAEEALARLAENAPQPGTLETLWAKIYATFRKATRPLANAMGIDPAGLSNAEIRWIVSAARGSLGQKGTTMTFSERGLEDVQFTKMDAGSPTPTFFSRLSDTILDPTTETRQTLGDGQPMAAAEMKTLIGELEGESITQDEIDALGLESWLDRLENEGQSVSIQDVQQFVREHQVHVSGDISENAQEQAADEARRRLSRSQVRLEKAQSRLDEVAGNIDAAAQDAVTRLRDAVAEQAGEVQASQMATQFQSAINRAMESPSDNPLRALADNLQSSEGTSEEIVAPIEKMADMIDELGSVRREVREAEERVSEAEEAAGRPAVEAETPQTLTFRLPEAIRQRVVRNRIDEVRAELDVLSSNLQEAQEAIGLAEMSDQDRRQAREALDERIRQIQDRIGTLEERYQSLRNALGKSALTNGRVADIDNRLAEVDVRTETANGDRVLVIDSVRSSRDNQKEEGTPTGELQSRMDAIGERLTELDAQIQEARSNENASRERELLSEQTELLVERSQIREQLATNGGLATDVSDILQDRWDRLTAKRLMLEATERGIDRVEFAEGVSLNAAEAIAQTYGGETTSRQVEEGTAREGVNISDRMKRDFPENGTALYRSGERQIDSGLFKRWFGDWTRRPSEASKAVNPRTGEPRVMYHGTNTAINRPDGPFYVTPEARDASSYAADRAKYGQNRRGTVDDIFGANVMPVYIQAKNPIDLRNMQRKPNQNDVIDRLVDEGVLTDEEGFQMKEELAGRKVQVFRLLEFNYDSLNGDSVHDRIQQSDLFDSVALRDERPVDSDQEMGGPIDPNTEPLFSDSWVVYDDTQVKSATGNAGTFSNQAGDVRFSKQENRDMDEVNRKDEPDPTSGETAQAQDPKNPQDVVGQMKKMLSEMVVPGTDGAMRAKQFMLEKGATNVVNEQTGEIKVTSFSDVENVAEMVGEFLYFEFKTAIAEQGWNAKDALSELDTIARQKYKDRDADFGDVDADVRRSQAMATLIGRYLQGKDISSETPNLAEQFDEFAQKYHLEDNFHHVQELFRAYNSQSTLASGLAKMTMNYENGWIGKRIARSKDEWKQWLKEYWYTQIYDEYYPLYKMARDMNGGKFPESVEENAYIMARMSAGSDGVAETFLSDQVRTIDGERLGPSMQEALRPVAESQQMWKQFGRYAIARRALELHEQKENGERPDSFQIPHSKEEAQEIIDWTFGAESEQFGQDGRFDDIRDGLGYDQDAFETAFSQLQEYNNALLEYAVREGYLSRDEKQSIQEMNEAYVPYDRIFQEMNKEPRSMGSGGDGLNYMEGSKDYVIDNPIQNMIQNTFSLVEAIHKNRTYQAVWDQIPQGDERNVLSASYARKVDNPQQKVQFTPDKVAQMLKENGATDEEAEQMRDHITDDEGEMITTFIPAAMDDLPENVVQVKVDGEAKYMRLNPELYTAIEYSPEPYDNTLANVVARASQGVQTVFRNATTTYQPFFALKEAARDTFDRAIKTTAENTPEAISSMLTTNLRTAAMMTGMEDAEWTEAVEDFKSSGAWAATLSMVQKSVAQNRSDKVLREAMAEKDGGGFMGLGHAMAEWGRYFSETFNPAKRQVPTEKDTRIGSLWKQTFGVSPEKIQNFNNVLENQNRVKEYKKSYDTALDTKREEYAENNDGSLEDNAQALKQAKREASMIAGFRARNVTIDFGRKGRTAKLINRYVPFFNSALQGYDRGKKSLTRNTVSTLSTLTAVQVIPAMLTAVINAGNPHYERKSYERDMNFLIPKPGTEDKNGYATEFYQIPKVHFFGPTIASAAERFTHFMVSEGHVTGEKIMNNVFSRPHKIAGDAAEGVADLGKQISRGRMSSYFSSAGGQFPINLGAAAESPIMALAGTLIPQAMLTPLEIGMNYSTFRQQSIVPQSETGEKLAPYLSYDAQTSRVSKQVAEWTGTNPRNWDHFLNSTFGTGGRILKNQVGGRIMRMAEGEDPQNMRSIRRRAERELSSGEVSPSQLKNVWQGYSPEDVPPVDGEPESSNLVLDAVGDVAGAVLDPLQKSFVARSDYQDGQAVSNAYQISQRAQKANRTLNEMVKRGRSKSEIKEYIEDNILELALARQSGSDNQSTPVGSFRSTMNTLSKREEFTTNQDFSQTSGVEKVSTMQKVNMKRTEISRKFLEKVYNKMDEIESGEIDAERLAE
jgi:hypothetical protein